LGHDPGGSADRTRDVYRVTRLALVVEDRAELRGLLSDYLLSRGFVPMPAANGAHVDVICETLAPDLVLLDLPLADGDGTHLIRKLRTRHPAARIAVCTLPDTDREVQYRAEGIREIVRMPFDLAELDATIARLLAAPPVA